MADMNRRSVQPVPTAKTNRVVDMRTLTSLPAGKMVPLAAFPLLREDAVRQGRMRFSFEMMETAEILMNAINVNVKAYLVPFLAFDRFLGVDDLNRSYEGIPYEENGTPTPFIETAPFGAKGANKIYYHLGLHAKPTAQVNTAYVEAYNQIWNFRAGARSRDIPKRTRLQSDLAPAFWSHQNFRHIVPDFDQAVIDGEIALNLVSERLPVKGIGFATPMPTVPTGGTDFNVKETGGGVVNYKAARASAAVANTPLVVRMNGLTNNAAPEVWAELQGAGITVSLSNIELAKKTQAYAKLRAAYADHSEEYVVNLLMDGISVPEQALKQPMLLADKTTIFGMSKRYASDSGNLTESVVNGATFLDISINLPAISTGGVIMIVAEITPEQLFERQMDPFLMATGVDDLPQYLRDTLDPEKVSVVSNEYVDMDHEYPQDTFGYAPLNHQWNMTAPRIGGRFYRPDVDAGFDEDRQRIWAVETKNPVLSADFYLCTNMHTKPFVVTNQDPFEAVGRGTFIITGNTVFGGELIEASNDYDKVLAEAPDDRIVKPAN